MLVSALKMKRATEEIISFTVSKSFYHVCRIILEYHMNIIWENLSFVTYTQRAGMGRVGERGKKGRRYANVSVLNHTSCSQIYRNVIRINFQVFIITQSILALMLTSARGKPVAHVESQWKEPRQNPGPQPGLNGAKLTLSLYQPSKFATTFFMEQRP